MNRVSDTHAAWLVRRVCERHIQESPADESPLDEVSRANRSCAALTAAIGARVNPIFMDEVLTTFAEIESVECGTHPDLIVNAALTVNNKPDLLDQLNQQLSREIAELLAHTEPLQVREEAMV